MYLLSCRDKADALDLRLANRPAHLDYVGAQGEIVFFAGPMVDDADEAPQGSVFLLNVDTRADVEAFNASDPYTQANLWAEVSIQRVRQVVPAPEAS